MTSLLVAAPLKDTALLSVEQLARELNDDVYSVREKATEQLWYHGTSALPRLREMMRSKNPEEAIRARELVRKIEMGLFPDTDPNLLAIVEAYPDALPSEKDRMIRELQNRRAWRQMLKLHQEENNPMVRKQYLDTMQRIAVYAARERLSKGEHDEALELLKLAPNTAQSLLALAHYHRVAGSLPTELREAAARKDSQSASWRLALHRAAGNMEGALLEVDADKTPLLAAALAALNGDPLPWLQMRSSDTRENASRRENAESRSIYARLASDRWKGNQMDPTDLGKLMKMRDNRSSQYRRVARSAFFMLGEHQTAEESLIDDAPMMAAYYLLLLERLDEALKLLGTSIEEPCSEAWVDERLKSLDEDAFENFDDSDKVHSLTLMAGFLESRGMHELAFKCFRDPCLDFAKREKRAFLNFMMKLFNDNESFLPAPQLAIRLSAEWAKDNDERWGSLTDAFWAGDDDSYEWWRLLGKLDTEASRAKRLEVVLMLVRRLPGEKGERQRWIELAWKRYVNTKDREEKEDLLRRLVSLAFSSGDIELSEKVWDLRPEDMQASYFWRQQVSHLSARGKWDAVCKILLEQVKMMEEKQGASINPAFHAYAAAALHRAGRINEAKHHDYMADLLCLGDSSMAMQIALAYAFGEDYERSRLWWARAAQCTDPAGNMFPKAIAAYADSLLMEPSGWNLVAALNEVASCENIEANYYEPEVPLTYMRMRLKADTYRALCRLNSDRRAALAILEKSHQNYISDGVLADFFFPVLRLAGLTEDHDRWFELSWKHFSHVLANFPDSANTLNTTAWFASRAQRRTKEAESFQKKALAIIPDHAAYIDTMAEIQFAMGKRKDAMVWSQKAIMIAPDETELRQQLHHFRTDPLPK